MFNYVLVAGHPYVGCDGHAHAASALIMAHVYLRGKNRETGTALGSKHSRQRWGRGEDERRHRY